MEFVEDPNDWWKYKDAINKKIHIVDLIRRYGLEIEEKGGQEYTHRLYCPIHSGKNGGMERTPSMFVYSKTNSFYCFGCGTSGTPFEFVRFIEGIPESHVMEKLVKISGIENLELNAEIEYNYEPVKTIDPYVLEMSIIIRNHIRKFIGTEKFEKELKWIEKICKKLDIFLERIGYEDWEEALKIRNNLYKKIKTR